MLGAAFQVDELWLTTCCMGLLLMILSVAVAATALTILFSATKINAATGQISAAIPQPIFLCSLTYKPIPRNMAVTTHHLGQGRRSFVAALALTLTVLIAVLFVVSLGHRGNRLLRVGLALLLGGAFSNTGGRVLITSMRKVKDAVKGKAGTVITADGQ